jgi:hypothetical protein
LTVRGGFIEPPQFVGLGQREERGEVGLREHGHDAVMFDLDLLKEKPR